MAGTAVSPAPVDGMAVNGGNDALTASFVNSYRISVVADRLALHIQNSGKNDTAEFVNLCLSLSRGIDYAIANQEVPDRVKDLPLLLKQVCQCKNDPLLQAAAMVLMISVKSACNRGWFSDKDSEELLIFAHEIGNSFCSTSDINTEARNSSCNISAIMSRFYPRMKMGHTLAFLEVKPGYGAFVIDFHISKTLKSSPEEKIRLFVAQTDNIETSSCIISPPQVNFLLNGKGVERRTNVFMDTGPQIPTIVTPMLKYGTNLLQAVGQFNGNYIIAVAFMSVIAKPEAPTLQDYVQPPVAPPDSDSEIFEGPSRISLNCPISFRCIRTPVKGHSCKHLQCFDLDNYVDINSRRPSWRCPHCNQYVCFIDIRIDQNMVKVLKEVGDNVSDVTISADGSWKAVIESNDHTDQPHGKTPNCKQDGPAQQETTCFSNASPDIMDLTEGGDEMDTVSIYETEDRKPFPVNCQSQSNVKNLTTNPVTNSMNEVNQNHSSHVEDDFWSGVFFSTFGSGTSSVSSDVQTMGGVSEAPPNNLMLTPVMTDAVSPALNQELESVPNNLQLQQFQFGNSIINNEYGRFPSIPRHINRTPVAVQALPAQAPTPPPQQRSRSSLNPLIHNGPSAASQISPAVPLIADGYSAIPGNVERQQQFSRPHLPPLQVSHMTSSPLQQYSGAQNWNHRDRSPILGQSAQQSRLPNAYRVSSALPTEPQNSSHQQPPNRRIPHVMNQSPSLVRSSPSAHSPQTQRGIQSGVGQTPGGGSSQNLQRLAAAQRVVQLARRTPSTSVPVQTPGNPDLQARVERFRALAGIQSVNIGGTTPVTRVDSLGDLTTEQNWRPTGRMRGSLSGRAYSDAVSQFIIQPTQPVQAARPVSNMTSPPPVVPSQLHGLTANSRDMSSPPASVSGGTGVTPQRPPGMH